jgi:hypothetical protein
VRYKPSGAIYARFRVKGRKYPVRVSLETDDLTTARNKLPGVWHEHQEKFVLTHPASRLPRRLRITKGRTFRRHSANGSQRVLARNSQTSSDSESAADHAHCQLAPDFLRNEMPTIQCGAVTRLAALYIRWSNSLQRSASAWHSGLAAYSRYPRETVSTRGCARLGA